MVGKNSLKILKNFIFKAYHKKYYVYGFDVIKDRYECGDC